MGRGSGQDTHANVIAARHDNEQIRSVLRGRRGEGEPPNPAEVARKMHDARPHDEIFDAHGTKPPARIWLNPAGREHRIGAPAVIVEAGGGYSVQGEATNGYCSVGVRDNGGEIWAQDGLPHREDGPALTCGDGTKEWWVSGKRHRNDGPAVELVTNDGTTYGWWTDGKLHRGGGLPAVERADGAREWWVDGKLDRGDDLPAVEHASGRRDWWVAGKRHREGDLPAREFANGRREWWLAGKRHRESGPAIVEVDGTELYYLKGKKLSAAAHAAAVGS